MSDREQTSAPRRSRTPLWVIEGLDIARLRAVPLRVVVGVVCVVGIVLAVVLPDLVPPTALVGAAVALAALLLGLAVAVAIDAADLTVRGPRHVRAAGGELVAILPTDATPESAMPLAEAVLEAREDGSPRLLLGLAAAGRDARRCAAWTDALAVALARTGASVLRVDLASGRSERPGLVEVVREGRKLPEVVAFDPELRLARIGAGRDHAGALETLPTLPTRLPRDLDVLLVALPTAASRQVVGASSALEHVLVVAERDTTSRVDLIAGLDALETGGLAAQVALLDDRTSARLTVTSPPEEGTADGVAGPDEAVVEPAAEEPQDEPRREPEPDAGEHPETSAASPDVTPADDPDAPPASDPDATQPMDLAELEGNARTEPAPEAEPEVKAGDAVAAGDEVAVEDPVAEQPEPPAPVAEQPEQVEQPAPPEPEASTAQAEAEEERVEDATPPPVEPPDSGIRLLPGAGTAPLRPSPDLQQPSVAARDVDVMDGAAAARAAAYADAQARAPEEPVAPPTRTASEAAEPRERRSQASPQPQPPAAHRPPADVDVPDPIDVTEELPRVGGRRPRPDRGADEPDRDDLRTTAQLAILLDDLQGREDRP
jgi:hypothetical protein